MSAFSEETWCSDELLFAAVSSSVYVVGSDNPVFDLIYHHVPQVVTESFSQIDTPFPDIPLLDGASMYTHSSAQAMIVNDTNGGMVNSIVTQGPHKLASPVMTHHTNSALRQRAELLFDIDAVTPFYPPIHKTSQTLNTSNTSKPSSSYINQRSARLDNPSLYPPQHKISPLLQIILNSKASRYLTPHRQLTYFEQLLLLSTKKPHLFLPTSKSSLFFVKALNVRPRHEQSAYLLQFSQRAGKSLPDDGDDKKDNDEEDDSDDGDDLDEIDDDNDYSTKKGKKKGTSSKGGGKNSNKKGSNNNTKNNTKDNNSNSKNKKCEKKGSNHKKNRYKFPLIDNGPQIIKYDPIEPQLYGTLYTPHNPCLLDQQLYFLQTTRFHDKKSDSGVMYGPNCVKNGAVNSNTTFEEYCALYPTPYHEYFGVVCTEDDITPQMIVTPPTPTAVTVIPSSSSQIDLFPQNSSISQQSQQERSSFFAQNSNTYAAMLDNANSLQSPLHTPLIASPSIPQSTHSLSTPQSALLAHTSTNLPPTRRSGYAPSNPFYPNSTIAFQSPMLCTYSGENLKKYLEFYSAIIFFEDEIDFHEAHLIQTGDYVGLLNKWYLPEDDYTDSNNNPNTDGSSNRLNLQNYIRLFLHPDHYLPADVLSSSSFDHSSAEGPLANVISGIKKTKNGFSSFSDTKIRRKSTNYSTNNNSNNNISDRIRNISPNIYNFLSDHINTASISFAIQSSNQSRLNTANIPHNTYNPLITTPSRGNTSSRKSIETSSSSRRKSFAPPATGMRFTRSSRAQCSQQQQQQTASESCNLLSEDDVTANDEIIVPIHTLSDQECNSDGENNTNNNRRSERYASPPATRRKRSSVNQKNATKTTSSQHADSSGSNVLMNDGVSGPDIDDNDNNYGFGNTPILSQSQSQYYPTRDDNTTPSMNDNITMGFGNDHDEDSLLYPDLLSLQQTGSFMGQNNNSVNTRATASGDKNRSLNQQQSQIQPQTLFEEPQLIVKHVQMKLHGVNYPHKLRMRTVSPHAVLPLLYRTPTTTAHSQTQKERPNDASQTQNINKKALFSQVTACLSRLHAQCVENQSITLLRLQREAFGYATGDNHGFTVSGAGRSSSRTLSSLNNMSIKYRHNDLHSLDEKLPMMIDYEELEVYANVEKSSNGRKNKDYLDRQRQRLEDLVMQMIYEICSNQYSPYALEDVIMGELFRHVERQANLYMSNND